ncbi:MAG: hypothetical protein QOE57_3253 [Acidimicrobiaceae bacterium]|nr:hypothetical protein [Acidimicrobiaceae bacterium]
MDGRVWERTTVRFGHVGLVVISVAVLAACGASSKTTSAGPTTTAGSATTGTATSSPSATTSASTTSTTAGGTDVPSGCSAPASNDGLKLTKGSATVSITGGDQPTETFTVPFDPSSYLYLAGRSIHMVFTNYKRGADISLDAAGFCSGNKAFVGATVAHPYHGDCDLTIDGFNSGGVKGHGECKGLLENFGSTHVDARFMFSATP